MNTTGKLVGYYLRLSEFDVEVFLMAVFKHQEANALSQWPTTGMDEAPLQDTLPVLMITEVQPEGEKTEKDTNIWQSLPGNYGVDTVQHDMQEVLQLSDGIDKQRPLTSSKFVMKKVNYPYCREVGNTAGNPASVYSYYGSRFHIIQAGAYCALQKFVPTSGRTCILYRPNHSAFAVTRPSDNFMIHC